jgi:hypothetical protein
MDYSSSGTNSDASNPNFFFVTFLVVAGHVVKVPSSSYSVLTLVTTGLEVAAFHSSVLLGMVLLSVS